MTEAEWIAFLQRPEIPVFNRAMLANPADDLPRLVFADWLDENCPDSRVCAVVRASMSGHPCTFHFLPVPAEVNVHAGRGRLRLELEPNPPPPDEHGCLAMWESGWVGDVRLRNSATAAVAAWLAHPQMSSVEGLELNDAGEGVAELVAMSIHLTAVRHLDMSMCLLGTDELRVLTTAKLPALRALTLFDNDLDDDTAAEIAGSPTFTPLTKLDLANNWIGPAGTQVLANSPHLTRLQALRLSHNPIGDEGAVAVFGSPTFAGLRSLDLERSEVGLIGVLALCESPHLRNLTTLDLSHNPLTVTSILGLTACPHLAGLTTLKLADSHLWEAGARALAESPNLTNLRELDLSSNPIGDDGLIALAASPLFDRLDKLSLGECGITVAGLRAIANAPRFADPRPLELWLTGNAFGENDQAVADELPPTLAAAVRTAIDWGIDRR